MADSTISALSDGGFARPGDQIPVNRGGSDMRVGVNSYRAQLAHLTFREPYAQYPSASRPKLSQNTAAVLTGAGFQSILPTDARLTYTHAGVTLNSTAATGNSVNFGTPASPAMKANTLGCRFQTDAPKFEIAIPSLTVINGASIFVDGQVLNLETNSIRLPTSGATRYITVDFGTDTAYLEPYITLTAAGSGYAVGDAVTLIGGTGTAASLIVQSVSSGGIVDFEVVSFGRYTALPTAPAASTTTGSGTGATFSFTTPQSANHTTRKMRRIEVVVGSPTGQGASLGAINIGTNDTLIPYPLSGPRFMVFGDSYVLGTQNNYAWGAWHFRMARRLGVDDHFVSGVGATGYLRDASGYGSTYRGRVSDITAYAPTTNVPYVVLVQGSINDYNQTAATLQTEVTTFWNQLFTALPSAYLVCTTPMAGTVSQTVDSARAAAVRAGFQAAQATYDPSGFRSGLIDTWTDGVLTAGGNITAPTTAGTSGNYLYSDSLHPTQAGHDLLGDYMAGKMLGVMKSWDLMPSCDAVIHV